MNKIESNKISLNLSYISENVIVMGNFYVNDSFGSIINHLKTNHENHYKIYNLCSESEYNIEQDINNVISYPFNSNNPCALQVLIEFCHDADEYLRVHSKNVIIIHCKNGMGRSCMFAACYLLHSSNFTDSTKVISFVNKKRCGNENVALNMPSQIRYIHYYEMMLRTDHIRSKTFRVKKIVVTTVPHMTAAIINGGCVPSMSLSVLVNFSNEMNQNTWYPKQIYNQNDWIKKKPLKKFYTEHDNIMEFELETYEINIRGDVCLSMFSEQEKMCQIYYNTCFINENVLNFDKSFVDIAHKDKNNYTYNSQFRVSVYLKQVKDDPSINNCDHYIDRKGQINEELSEKERAQLLYMYNFGDTNIID